MASQRNKTIIALILHCMHGRRDAEPSLTETQNQDQDQGQDRGRDWTGTGTETIIEMVSFSPSSFRGLAGCKGPAISSLHPACRIVSLGSACVLRESV